MVNQVFDLPLVLLGLSTAILYNCNVSPTDITVGSQVRIPGDFVSPHRRCRDTTSSVQKRITRFLANLQTPQTRLPLDKRIHISQDLHKVGYVWASLDHMCL